MNRLEDIQVEGFWQTFLECSPPPPDMKPEDIELAKAIFMQGFGAMVALACHLHTQSPETRAVVLTLIRKQLEPSPDHSDLN